MAAAAAAILNFQKLEILMVNRLVGANMLCIVMPNFVKIGQTVVEISEFNGFQNGGHPPSWILKIQRFNA